MVIILGIKGREWAWQAKKWDSVEHFNEVQKKWSIAGVVLLVAIFVITFISVILVVIAIDPVTRVQEEQMREQQFMDFQNSP